MFVQAPFSPNSASAGKNSGFLFSSENVSETGHKRIRAWRGTMVAANSNKKEATLSGALLSWCKSKRPMQFPWFLDLRNRKSQKMDRNWYSLSGGDLPIHG